VGEEARTLHPRTGLTNINCSNYPNLSSGKGNTNTFENFNRFDFLDGEEPEEECLTYANVLKSRPHSSSKRLKNNTQRDELLRRAFRSKVAQPVKSTTQKPTAVI